MLNSKLGTLYVVATPIGNLQDITFRAVEILKFVDRIVAEDTRHSGSLLKHFSIIKPIISLHNFNELDRNDKIIHFLQAGENIALISDAGTPLISDPGYSLVRTAKSLKIDVVPIPGACAAIAALCAGGIATDRFIFEGFLPAKEESKRKVLSEIIYETRSIIFYEAPHRLLATLEIMRDVFGDARLITIARELTKLHESIITDTIVNLVNYYLNRPQEVKGEIVIIVSGVALPSDPQESAEAERILSLLLEELPLKQAVILASKITKQRKNELYNLALAKKSKE